MSKYTTEVRFICETLAGETESAGGSSVNGIIERSYEKIFDSDLPFFDEEYGKLFKKKILKHFYTREIGFETMGLWVLKLNTKMNELLPYYNQLWQSALLEFKPFDDVNYIREHKGTYDTSSNATRGDNFIREDNLNQSNVGSTNSSELSAYSDTPQGGLSGVDNLEYLTNATKTDNNSAITNNQTNTGTQTTKGTQTNVGTINNVDNWLEKVTGKTSSSSYSELLMKYRQTFMNIDMQFINELNDLFMLVY